MIHNNVTIPMYLREQFFFFYTDRHRITQQKNNILTYDFQIEQLVDRFDKSFVSKLFFFLNNQLDLHCFKRTIKIQKVDYHR